MTQRSWEISNAKSSSSSGRRVRCRPRPFVNASGSLSRNRPARIERAPGWSFGSAGEVRRAAVAVGRTTIAHYSKPSGFEESSRRTSRPPGHFRRQGAAARGLAALQVGIAGLQGATWRVSSTGWRTPGPVGSAASQVGRATSPARPTTGGIRSAASQESRGGMAEHADIA